MKAHTQTFKDNLTTLGKEINAKVTYTIDGAETELDGDTLGSVTPHYEGNILKSVMKQIDIVSDVDIPIGTIINVQFGMRYNTDEYEYVDYGNYVVNKSEKQEDTNNYKIIAYDKMLYAMKDYEELDITYPITIRDYINAICTKIGLTFANINDTFANYDKEITQDLYKDLGYTYRDILTELAQVTASTICINKDDELEVRYINQAIAESEQLSGTSFDLESDEAPLGIDEIDGEITQETTILPSGYTQVEYIESNGTQYIDTGVNADSNMSIDIDYLFTTSGASNYMNTFGVIRSTGAYSRYHFQISTPTQLEFSYYNTSQLLYQGTYTDRIRAYVDMYNLKCTTWKNGEIQIDVSLTNYGNWDSQLNFWLFRRNSQDTSLQYYSYNRIYHCKMYVSGVLVRDFIPCYRNSDNVIGLYDLVNNVFYTNQGTGTFTKGSNVILPTPEYPQDIEITTGRQSIDLVGKNKYEGSQDFSGTWTNTSRWTTDSETYNGLVVKKRDSMWEGLYKEIKVESNKTYTYSLYMKSDNPRPTSIYLSGGTATTSVAAKGYNTTKDWERYSITFTCTKSGTIRPRVENTSSNVGNYTYICGYQLEENNTITEYELYKGKEHEINLGKNVLQLLYEHGFTRTTNGITYTYNNDGTISVKGTATANSSEIIANQSTSGLREMLLSGDYYLSGSPSGSSSGTYRLQIYGYTATGTGTFSTYENGAKVTTFVNENANFNMAIYVSSGQTIDLVFKPQLEKGDTKTSYSPYFEPIFLGKINDYKDFIRKGNGKNLFDKDNANILNAYFETNTPSLSSNDRARTLYIECLPNTTYTITKLRGQQFNIGCTNIEPVIGTTIQKIENGPLGDYNGTTKVNYTYTTNETAKYLLVRYAYATQVDLDLMSSSIQIEENDHATEYEPYGFKDKWYIYKAIGKVVLDGSESWNISNSGGINWYYIANISSKIIAPNISFGNFLSTHYSNKDIANGNTQIGFNILSNGTSLTNIRVRYGTEDTTTNYKNWLSTNNVVVYSPLATPIITEITSSNYPELYSQLKAIEKARTFDGVTYIDSTTPINIDYIKQLETFNEDYIKNTRADFGEKYGPINSIVLSRSAESDNIYLRDEDSIDENGLCEVKIKDNQIMNDNNRDQYLSDLLEYLKQVEYYVNDFESIGITYLDLLDRYKVIIGDKSYYCVMLNDEVGIHDGLNEIIYTEKPKEEVTEYKKASTTDKQARQTYLMVDKQAQRIDALVSDEEENFSRIQVEIDNISSQVQSTNVELDNLGNEINVVRSSISEQTSEAITDWFNTALKPTIEDLENSVDSNDQTLNEIKSYVRRGVITDAQSPYYNQAFVELGDTTNQTTLRILPNRIQFLTNGQETAFISNNQLYINESTILTKEKIGNWVTTQDENGLLNTYWED